MEDKMRYSEQGEVRPDYASLSGVEAGELFAKLMSGGHHSRDLFDVFLALCELRAVIAQRELEDGGFDWSKNEVYQKHLAGPGNHAHRMKTDPAYAADFAAAVAEDEKRLAAREYTFKHETA